MAAAAPSKNCCRTGPTPCATRSPLWHGWATDAKPIEHVFRWHTKLREAAQALASGSDDAAVWIERVRRIVTDRPELVGDGGELRLAAIRMLSAHKAFDEARRTLAKQVDASDPWLGVELGDRWLVDASLCAAASAAGSLEAVDPTRQLSAPTPGPPLLGGRA
jgi:hypothetical protein